VPDLLNSISRKLKPGTSVVREYQGVRHIVTISEGASAVVGNVDRHEHGFGYALIIRAARIDPPTGQHHYSADPLKI
jgi:hypothetical protein